MHRTRIVSFLRPLTLAVALTALPTTALAGASTASDLSYTYVRLSAFKGEADAIDIDGFATDASVAISEQFYLTAGYAETKAESTYDYADVDLVGFGIGFHAPIDNSIDFIAEFEYADAKTNNGWNSVSDSAYGLNFGFRGMDTGALEWRMGLQIVDISSKASTSGYIGADYFVTDTISLGLDYEKSKDSDAISVNARYNF